LPLHAGRQWKLIGAANGGSMWQQSSDGRVSHPFEPVILGATSALIPVLIIERDVSSGPWATAAEIANWVIWAIFAAELLFILVVAPRKAAAVRAHWLDVAIVLVTIPFYGTLLSSLRAVRLFRLLRLLRATVVVARAIQAERKLASGSASRLAVLATVFLTVIAGAVQSTVNSGDFTTFWDGVWWAVQTVTTAGYGELEITTTSGRIIAIGVMLLVGFLAVLTATIASHFVQADQHSETSEVLETLHRIEADMADLKARLASRQR
jgi:voltage-gated potassium channel